MLAAAAFMLLIILWLAPQRQQVASGRPLPHVLLGSQRMGQQVPTRTWTLLLLLLALW